MNDDLVLKNFLLCELTGITNSEDLGFYFSDLPEEIKSRRADLEDFVWGQWRVPVSFLKVSPHLDGERLGEYLLKTSEPPPAIIKLNSETREFEVIDGNHRIQTAISQGKDMIVCFLGIKKEDARRWIVEGDPVSYLKNYSVSYFERLKRELLDFEHYEKAPKNKEEALILRQLHSSLHEATINKLYTVGLRDNFTPKITQHKIIIEYFLRDLAKTRRDKTLRAIDLIFDRLSMQPEMVQFDHKILNDEVFKAFSVILELYRVNDEKWSRKAKKLELDQLIGESLIRLSGITEAIEKKFSAAAINLLLRDEPVHSLLGTRAFGPVTG